jgi:hypothetical protein
VPFFAHELVKRCLVQAIERDQADSALRLLVAFGTAGLVSLNQMNQARERAALLDTSPLWITSFSR